MASIKEIAVIKDVDARAMSVMTSTGGWRTKHAGTRLRASSPATRRATSARTIIRPDFKTCAWTSQRQQLE